MPAIFYVSLHVLPYLTLTTALEAGTISIPILKVRTLSTQIHGRVEI